MGLINTMGLNHQKPTTALPILLDAADMRKSTRFPKQGQQNSRLRDVHTREGKREEDVVLDVSAGVILS